MEVKIEKCLIDKKFLFRMSDKLRTEVKVRAAKRNVSMGRWITQAILQRIAYEQKFEDDDK
jgi:predicted HicB family RNase H-like nuclease